MYSLNFLKTDVSDTEPVKVKLPSVSIYAMGGLFICRRLVGLSGEIILCSKTLENPRLGDHPKCFRDSKGLEVYEVSRRLEYITNNLKT